MEQPEIHPANVIFFNIYMYMSMLECICIYVIICPKTIISVAHPPFLSYMTAFFKTNFGNFYNKIITYMYYVLKHKSRRYIATPFLGS